MSTDLLILIPLAPLFGAVINGIIGKALPRWLSGTIGCVSIGISFVLSLVVFRMLDPLNPQSFIEATLFSKWIFAENLNVPVAFVLDRLSSVMILVVCGVSFLIHIYSLGYMGHDKGYSRYFAYLNLFCFSMLTLVLADNLLLMFLGWEGVGLCSYLLIGFWFDDEEKAKAGKKAFIVNRIGDFGFILGILFTFYFFRTINFSEISLSISEFQSISSVPIESVATLICLLLFVGAMGKSAQIPLYVWLPDAMAGPTPVSALIHAATMVTAGIYMIGRMHFLYDLAPLAQNSVLIIGTLTAFFAATVALVQNDIKKVLAYSTISQLGYMFMAMGLGVYYAGIFHLATHAFFKALLFLGAGSVIHTLHNQQDIRKMGGLKNYMVITTSTFFVATLAISGFVLLSGWWSKDAILLEAINSDKSLGFACWLIGVITALLTAFYMFRLFTLVFTGTPRINKEELKTLHESPPSMTIPLIVLGILSVFGGIIGISTYLKAFFPELHSHHAGGSFLGNHTVHGILISVLSLGSMGLAFYIYSRRRDIPEKVAQKLSGLYEVLSKKYMVDEFYESTVVKPVIFIAKVFTWFDRWIIDGIVNLMAYLVKAISYMASKVQTGFVQAYAFFIVAGVILILGYLFWI